MSAKTKNTKNHKNNKLGPVVLIIRDGWGVAPPNKGNAATLAKTPNLDSYLMNYPWTLLAASGIEVGLPPNQEGNSEAGHMNLGAGRVVIQDSVYISRSINDGSFFKNLAFKEAINHVKKNKSKIHLLGLLSSSQSAHIDPDHLLALLVLLKHQEVKDIYLHLFTDGRDSPRYMALELIQKLKKNFTNNEKIASISGRYYAMDRAKRWDRTRQAYDAMVMGEGLQACSVEEAISRAYNRGENDEYITPTIIAKNHRGKCEQKKISSQINKNATALIEDNDAILFFNLRSDRARQLTKPFVQKYFDGFERRKTLKNLKFVSLTDFGPDLGNVIAAYPSRDVAGSLTAALKDYRQFYIAESEKYAHITYFFNGGFAEILNNEERALVLSSNVKNYSEQPEMSAPEITEIVVDHIKHKRYDFIALNFANADMVGHTGVLEAGVKACEVVDDLTGQIVREVLKKDGVAILTADHGNVEGMINPKTGEVDTEHSTNPVHFVVVSKKFQKFKLKSKGVLGDVAPTILDIMKVPKTKEMTRRSLLIKK